MIRTRTLAVAQISGKGIAGYVTVDTATSRRHGTIVAPHATDAQVEAPRAHMLGGRVGSDANLCRPAGCRVAHVVTVGSGEGLITPG